jgi:hypothetical protein
MGRTLLAVLLGAVIHFAWGYVSHVQLDWHERTTGNVPNETGLVSALGAAASEEKVYMFPPHPDKSATEAMLKEYQAKVKDGTSGLVMVNHGGIEPWSPQQFGNAFLLELVATVMVVFVLVVTLPAQQTYLKRVFVVIVMGIFAAATRDLLFWNWMGYPLYYTAINAADCVVGWTAAGIVIAALVKPSAPAAPGAAPAKA